MPKREVSGITESGFLPARCPYATQSTVTMHWRQLKALTQTKEIYTGFILHRYRVKLLRLTWHKTGHFRDILPRQSLGWVQKTRAQQLLRWATVPEQSGPKSGGLLCPFLWGELGAQLTMSPGPRPTFVPSGIPIHPAIWPQKALVEKWVGLLCPFPWRSWVPI